MIAVFAMIIAQMQSQAAHPDVLLTITSSIGSFHDDTSHGYDITHDLKDGTLTERKERLRGLP